MPNNELISVRSTGSLIATMIGIGSSPGGDATRPSVYERDGLLVMSHESEWTRVQIPPPITYFVLIIMSTRKTGVPIGVPLMKC